MLTRLFFNLYLQFCPMLHNTLVKSQDYVETISILAFSPEKYINNVIKTF